MLYLCRRVSSLGVQLFRDRGKSLEPLSVLAETEEVEDDGDEPQKSGKSKETPASLQKENNKPKDDIKDGDPLAALGNKLAKLRLITAIFLS